MQQLDGGPYCHLCSPILIRFERCYERMALFLSGRRIWWFSMRVICIFRPVPIPVAIIPIFITVPVTFGVKLGDHGAYHTTTCKLKPLNSIPNQADSNLARTRDEDRCSSQA